MNVIRLFLGGVSIALTALILFVLPVLAIANPDAIRFYAVGATPVYRVFYDVRESGDMLFLAEQYVYYAVTPNETASEAFTFEVLTPNGTETIASVTLKEYGAKPISIYMNAAQVSLASISVGDSLILRIAGNPVMFSGYIGNSVNATLATSNYVDQLLGDDEGIPTANPLRNFIVNILADDIEDYDSPPAGSEYLVTVSGVKYLSTTGGSIFLEGIPALDEMCPILFQYSMAPMESEVPESTGAYTSTLSPLAKWGETVSDGLTNLGLYLGISQGLAGSTVLMGLSIGLAFYVYGKTQSGLAVLLLVGTTPFLGAWLGLLPLALAFVFTILLVILMGFFFFSRGAL